MSDEEEDFFLKDPQKAGQPMEISIETLSGTVFDVPVRPTDTVLDIKTKIQRVEGIPTHHQNLLFHLKELEDFKRLSDVGIKNGSKLKLVLSMRGGPISTRRLTTCIDRRHIVWKDLKELIEHTREEIAEKPESTSKVSVLVFKEGAAINLIRVIENEDGSYSPYLKENREKRVEMVKSIKKMSEDSGIESKMEILRSKMENLEVLEDESNELSDLNDLKSLKSRFLNRFLSKKDEESEDLDKKIEKNDDVSENLAASSSVFDEIESNSIRKPFYLHKSDNNLHKLDKSPCKTDKVEGVKELKGVSSGKNRRMRCEKCKKRLNLTNWYLCRCEKAFCTQHRLPEVHDCGYDFKGEGRRVLERENPVVKGVKVVKF
ncbi:AN1-type zinc finger protein 4-like [Onthophagus taurus]|uniref:AN1-type zinc finger protein 4-like n=1 Tax=Onthophagus taurus TaxID=166361 RepID=UPI000C2034A4|nr:AN1-type zinc finger protein 4-like [Onthophagus taurus]